MKKIILLLFLATTFLTNAQNVGIGTNTPHASAQLDITSTLKGMLVPRMTTAQRTAIASPAPGLLVYDINTNSFWYWTGLVWQTISTPATAWSLFGNSGTSPATNFIGTTDNSSLLFKVNNQKSGYIGVEPNDGNVFWGYQSGNNNSGFNNVGIGTKALHSNNSSSNLVAIGDSALFNNSTGTLNTAVGSKSMFLNTTGYFNTANGYHSLYSNINGVSNTATGHESLFTNDFGYNNTANGYHSLYSNTGGGNNTAIGTGAMEDNTTGSNNSAIGVEALHYNSTGEDNAANGPYSLMANETGQENTGNGARSLYRNISGNGNSGVGSESLLWNTTGNSNVGIGIRALFTNTSMSNLVAVGDSALYANIGPGNTAVGSKSLYSNTTGGNNTANGYQALYTNSNGFYNTAIGYASLFSNWSGQQNTAIGMNALHNNISGNGNTATGMGSLYSNSSGASNTSNGFSALQSNTLGSFNTAQGNQALFSNSIGNNNTAFGSYSLQNNTSGNSNSAFGYMARTNNFSNATAIGANSNVDCNNCLVLGSVNTINGATSNVDVGIGITNPLFPLSFGADLGDKISLWGNSVNSYGFGIQTSLLQIHTDIPGTDIAFGYGSSGSFTENMRIKGNGNVGIGTTTPDAPLSFSSSLSKKITLYPGSTGDAGFGVFGNELRINSDYSGADITFGYDNYGTGFHENMRVTGTGGNLLVRGAVTANSSFYTSDIRYKKNLQPIHLALERIIQLQGYNYYWKDVEQDPSLQSGVIAQEVQKIFPELVRADNKGYLSVNYVGLIPYLIQSIKEQQAQINQLSKENEELKKIKTEVAELRKMIEKL